MTAAENVPAVPLANAVPLSCFDPPLRDLMARIGPVWGSDIRGHIVQVWSAFAPLLAAAPQDGIAVQRDIAYGSHARQVLDLYVPQERGGAARPIVIFVHGGAFVRGEKDNAYGGYRNVCVWFARQGYVSANVGYRLAPESRFPGAVDDVAAAVAWVRGNAGTFGGDARRIVLIGHSAGGTHVAGYAYDPNLGHLGRGLAGICLISARLRADSSPRNPNAAAVKAYFGDDASLFEQRSPLGHGASSAIPTFVAIAQFENPLLDAYGAELVQARLSAGTPVRFVQMAGHNHSSIVAHFNTQEEILGREIVRFMQALPASSL